MPIRKSLLSGLLIGLGAYGNLALGGLPGAIIFAFGLIGVVLLRVPLYTGVAGVVQKDEMGRLLVIWLFNCVGCALMGLAAYYCSDYSDTLHTMVARRMDDSLAQAFIKAAGCGFIIDVAAYMAREKGTMLPVVFGIPLFIVCGFYHSIADVMYFFAAMEWHAGIPAYYVAIFLGNFAGCNIRRLLLPPGAV